MSPFRLFGRGPDLPDSLHDAAADPGTADDAAWAAGAWAAVDEQPGTATRHARPVAFGRGPGLARVDDDPMTDPYGFPPLPSSPSRSSSGSSAPSSGSRRDPGAGRRPLRPVRAAPPAAVPPPPPDPMEAAALAGAFAADYLSWDEDDPGRRGRALADHLAPVANPALLGWDGRGRQRAEFALPGLVRADGDDRVLVDVRVRVTPYREVGAAADRAADRAADAAEGAEAVPDVPGVPAAAPAPTGRGWRGCASYWVRLSVPVVREDGRLVVDAADEASELPGDGHDDGAGPAVPPPPDAAAPDSVVPDRPRSAARAVESAW